MPVISVGRLVGLLAVASIAACNGQIAPVVGEPGDGQQILGGALDPPAENGEAKPEASAVFTSIGYPPDSLAIDAHYLYWNELGSVYRATKTYPRPERIFGGGTSAAWALTVDDTHLYYVDRNGGGLHARLKNGAVSDLAFPAVLHAFGLTQDATSLYVGVSSYWGAGAPPADETGIRIIDKATRTQKTLRPSERVQRVAVSGTAVYSAEIDSVTMNTSRIVRTSLEDGASEEVGRSTFPPHDFVADGSEVYWIDERGLMSSRDAAIPVYAPPAGRSLSAGLTIRNGLVYVTEIAGPGAAEAKVLRVSLAPWPRSAPALITSLFIDAPTGSYRSYGIHQANDGVNLYVSAFWSSDADSKRGDVILRVPLMP